VTRPDLGSKGFNTGTPYHLADKILADSVHKGGMVALLHKQPRYEVMGWIAGNTYSHYAEHAGWIRDPLSRPRPVQATINC
jgi:hypothetical protein